LEGRGRDTTVIKKEKKRKGKRESEWVRKVGTVAFDLLKSSKKAEVPENNIKTADSIRSSISSSGEGGVGGDDSHIKQTEQKKGKRSKRL